MKKVLFFIITVAVIFSLDYVIGYRLTPLDAAQTLDEIGKDAEPLSQIDWDSGSIIILKTAQNSYYTVITEKQGPLYKSRAIFPGKHSNQSIINTVGMASYGMSSGQLTVFAVETASDQVAYIEAGTGQDRQRKAIVRGKPVVFYWDSLVTADQLNAVALSRDNKELYRYNYPVGAGQEAGLQWMPISH